VAGRKHYARIVSQIGESGSKSWLLRYQRNGKERWMGLGPKSVFTVKEARARARAAQQQIYDGIDRLLARREQRALQALQEAAQLLSRVPPSNISPARTEMVERHAPAGVRQHVAAVRLPRDWQATGAAVDNAAVLRIVEPIWLAKNQTGVTGQGTDRGGFRLVDRAWLSHCG